ncbi:MAG TPA: glycosyltransferase family 2 protein [Candidatus Gastranaerophilales bacterium]|nr:glycosyltransferase family 2 protein [Candidatus Gastranaerophilales bacterium]
MDISIIVPIYNETENLDEFYLRTIKILESINLSFEIIFVNDGSADNTLQRLFFIAQNDNRVKIIDLSRNFGKEIALTAGLDFSSGDAAVVIDADLQEPPELIKELIKKWNEGYDVVYAIRKKRGKEPVIKTILAYLFYRIMKKISQTDIPIDTGDYRLMSRQAVNALIQIREHHRFMKGLFSCVGFKQTGIYYEREQRHKGKSNINLLKLWNLAVDGITSFSFAPLQFSSFAGLIIAIISVLYAVYIIIKTMLYGNPVPGYPSLIVAITFLGGIQLLSLGIIGEYIARTYMESKKRPLYFIKHLTGFNAEDLKPTFKNIDR